MTTKPTLDELIKNTIDEWKHFWMNQHQNNEDDYKSYLRRAMGVDANMSYDLANRLAKAALTPSFLAQLPNELLKEHEGVKALLESLSSLYELVSSQCCEVPGKDYKKVTMAAAALKEWE